MFISCMQGLNGSDFEDIRDLVHAIADPADERVRKLCSTSREEDMYAVYKIPNWTPWTEHQRSQAPWQPHSHGSLGLNQWHCSRSFRICRAPSQGCPCGRVLAKGDSFAWNGNHVRQKALHLLPKPGPGDFEISFWKSTKCAPVHSALYGHTQFSCKFCGHNFGSWSGCDFHICKEHMFE